jgi:hypothetical protein
MHRFAHNFFQKAVHTILLTLPKNLPLYIQHAESADTDSGGRERPRDVAKLRGEVRDVAFGVDTETVQWRRARSFG